MGQEVKLRMVRLSFPDLFEATDFQGDKKFRYNASFILVPGSENDQIVKNAITAAAKETWDKPGQAEQKLASFFNNSNKNCYLLGDSKEYDGYKGMMILSAHRQQKDGKPGVFDVTRAGLDGKPMPLSIADGKPYAGCYVHALVDIYCQDGKNPGIRCGLRGVFFAKDGDAFSGSKVAANDSFNVEEGAQASDIG